MRIDFQDSVHSCCANFLCLWFMGPFDFSEGSSTCSAHTVGFWHLGQKVNLRPFSWFLPKKFSKMVDPKQILVIFISAKKKKKKRRSSIFFFIHPQSYTSLWWTFTSASASSGFSKNKQITWSKNHSKIS